MRLVNGPQDALATWLCREINLVPSSHLRCLGVVDKFGALRAVIGYDNFNGSAIEMHVAGYGGHWLTRRVLKAAFDYPFRVCKAKVIVAKVVSSNAAALRLDYKLGFRLCATIPDGHPDGALQILTMTRPQCRFLGDVHGWEIQSSAASGS